jgi:hypothetical protein
MSRNRKSVKVIRKYYRKICASIATLKKLFLWSLRTLLVAKKRRRSVNAGFVLPTVAMVSIVVVLLTVAIMFRSFERSQNASNVRVNETVLRAATPALDRAKAKISELFSDPTLPRAVPSNTTLYNTLVNKLKTYTLGDETPLTIAYDLDKNNKIEASATTLEEKETLETSWQFPVDTDNNGLFDSFTLYGIYFRNPPQSGVNPTRPRSPLDARTPPMLSGRSGDTCDIAGDTSASLVGSSGWYKVANGELKKSFFVYAVTVPISSKGNLDSKFEEYKGNKGFSAIELQQDRTQLPITNNAVVYEDDIDITPGPRLRINGRIFTNSNILMGKQVNEGDGSFATRLYQVSSNNSCYYERENAKVIVGGNYAAGGIISESDFDGAKLDLFEESAVPTTKELTSTNKSTSNKPNEVAYNSQAFAERIKLLVEAQVAKNQDTDPQEVKDARTRRSKDPIGSEKVRRQEIEIYFRKRTRRVPFAEVKYGDSGITGFNVGNVLLMDAGDNNSLRPPDKWVYPIDSNTGLIVNTPGLPAVDPDEVEKSPIKEQKIGDRILVGNNLPELRWDANKKEFVGEQESEEISGQKWDDSTITRYRNTRVRQLADLGDTQRAGFWEIAAAKPRLNELDVYGGLRVITGAGIYRRIGSFLPAPPQPIDDPRTPKDAADPAMKEDKSPVVWSDAMPMLGYKDGDMTTTQLRGDLVMRATAVYHYNHDSYDPDSTTPDISQKPIACVSSYYNPTNSTTATTNDYKPLDAASAASSNNGLTYKAPTKTSGDITRGHTLDADGLFIMAAANAEDVTNTSVSLEERLKYQANLVFPNGRFVNPLLRQALQKASASNLTLAEQSAIDTTICAIQIADGTLTADSTDIPDNAIRETAFLDARQLKAIDKPSVAGLQIPTGLYDLEIEQRQPLEVRATVIDLEKLKNGKKEIGVTWKKEYLFPNSGIIYASRDDAQPDRSNEDERDPKIDVAISPNDYLLDPTRRPNAIMLENGSDLSRETKYRAEEKGLILATDLPVYVKAASDSAFNKHTRQEFKNGDELTLANWDTKFYDRSPLNRDTDFACRPDDPRLPKCKDGETWRPASVIADSVTLLSKNFRDGYRNEGDYNLRNNQTDIISADAAEDAKKVRDDRLKNGFWDNNFVTTRDFTDSDYTGVAGAGVNSSYFNNFITPIQRRGDFPEYVMEMCFKLPVSKCGATDWYIGLDDGIAPITDIERKIKSSDASLIDKSADNLVAGTTSRPPKAGYEGFARRVAFLRDANGKLVKADRITELTIIGVGAERPIALGINNANNVQIYSDATVPNRKLNSLWFTTTTSAAANPADGTKKYHNTDVLFYRFPASADATFQPLLEPILQIHTTMGGPDNTTNYDDITKRDDGRRVKNSKWMPRADASEFNLVMAAGDTPGRVGSPAKPYYEINGGLHNFVRLLENWDNIDANIRGSFIQYKRSIFATAPFQVFLRPSPAGAPPVNSLFSERGGRTYLSDSAGGQAPFYMASIRNWGFDVALLSQNPDLFAQRFVIPSTDAPNEYYREVSRDDKWVQTLLCATANKFDATKNDYGYGKNSKTNAFYVLPQNLRPSEKECMNTN